MKNIQQQVERWLDNVVIGLQLCPFAEHPRQKNQIEICISGTKSIEELMACLVKKGHQLEETPAEELETILIVTPNLLEDFDDYLDCLYLAEQILESQSWQGVFQIASFHPQYQFEGTQINDLENLTNRSPYPIFHLLREDSVTKAATAYGDTTLIPGRNKKTITNLPIEERTKLFSYLSH